MGPQKPIQKYKSWKMLSSQIESTSYTPETEAMVVVFNNGDRWQYTPVSVETWEKALKTDSIGKFVNKEIKTKCNATKLV